MTAKGLTVLCGATALLMVLGTTIGAQEAGGAPGLRQGPAEVAPHWSKYNYPKSLPDGVSYVIIVKGDTLWDLSKHYLKNPFLWPQIWDANRYVTDAHWIYPGDPLILPNVQVVAEHAGAGGTPEGEGITEPGAESAPGASHVGQNLYPAIQEMALQCAHYIVPHREDESLYIVGSEQGATKVAFADRDILYLSHGSNAGLKPGDVYTIHHPTYAVKHPRTGRTIGTKIETLGWLRLLLVQENSSTAVVERACQDIHLGDYLKPFAPVTVPMVPERPPADRLSPTTGQTHGVIIDIGQDSMIAGTGQLVSLNVGSEHGVIPGNVFVVYRVMYPSVPTSRNVLGEVTVVSVRESTSVARVSYSNDAMLAGDEIELR